MSTRGRRLTETRTFRGKVYLVGAGPGDPGLLTRKGARLLRIADTVVHDALVGDRILDLIGEQARRIDVGKRCGGRRTAQDLINELLIESARTSRVVVRLKGGDPFVFGRGGEEALALAAAGVPFEVVPGVTAAVGASAYAGIPLTHREMASTVTFVTGHDGRGTEGGVDWDALAKLGGTVAIYMGVGTLDVTVDRLLRGGRAADTPAAVIEWGTHDRQRTVSGTLADIVAVARASEIVAPALVVVGEVAALRPQISWFDQGSLHGRRILVARSRAQPSRLAAALRSRGAEVTEYPRLVAEPLPVTAAIERAVGGLASRDWLLFTSPAAVRYFWSLLAGRGLDTRALNTTRIAALGAATTSALAERGVTPDLNTRTFDPATIERRLREIIPLEGLRILFPREAGADSPIAIGLRASGALVDEIEIVRVGPDDRAGDEQRALLDVDAIILPSSTAARAIASATAAGPGTPLDARVVAIGPRTAETALGCGLPVHAVAGDHSVRGVVGAVSRILGGIELVPEQGADHDDSISGRMTSGELATLSE